MSALMGIDVGTGSVKVELVDDAGRRWSASSASYGIDAPRPGWAEQRPERWWSAVVETVAAVWRRSELPARTTVTVGFTGQMHSTVLLDDRDRVVRPAILWCDGRAGREAVELGRRMPDLARTTGNAPLAAFTSSHLVWLARHEPTSLDAAVSLLMPKDYLRFRATGHRGTDWTDASGTNLLDITTRRWSAPVVAGTGVPARLLGPVLAPEEVVGPVHDLLPSGVRAEAVTGLGDEFAEALAVGLLDPGPLVVVIGTSGALLGVQDQPSAGVFCHATADRWLRLDSLHGAGMSLSWFRDTFAPGLDLDALTAEAAGVAPGADGLVFLPYLAGDRSTAGASARAGFLGARPSHTRAHFVRAVLEGVALELRRVATVRMGVVRPTQVVLKGGGARSALWAQIVADVFDAPLATSARTAASGALDVAGVGARWWDYTELAARATRTSVEPSADAGRYPAVFDHFVGTVAAVLGV